MYCRSWYFRKWQAKGHFSQVRILGHEVFTNFLMQTRSHMYTHKSRQPIAPHTAEYRTRIMCLRHVICAIYSTREDIFELWYDEVSIFVRIDKNRDNMKFWKIKPSQKITAYTVFVNSYWTYNSFLLKLRSMLVWNSLKISVTNNYYLSQINRWSSMILMFAGFIF